MCASSLYRVLGWSVREEDLSDHVLVRVSFILRVVRSDNAAVDSRRYLLLTAFVDGCT